MKTTLLKLVTKTDILNEVQTYEAYIFCLFNVDHSYSNHEIWVLLIVDFELKLEYLVLHSVVYIVYSGEETAGS